MRRKLVTRTHELMEHEGNLVRMGCAPRNNALELEGVVGERADLNQLCFDYFGVSHTNSSMAHAGSRVVKAFHFPTGPDCHRSNSTQLAVHFRRILRDIEIKGG